LPQAFDQTLATCAQISRYHSQLVATLHGLPCDPREIFSAAPLTALASLSMARQGIKETPAYVSGKHEQR
jgi:hypothetical protein